MARTHLLDDRAAYVLLAAAVKQCRKDLVRRHVRPEHRVSALDLFLTIGGFDGTDNTTTSSEGSAAFCAASGCSSTSFGPTGGHKGR